MPVYKAEAIVLRRANLGEADRLVTLFARDQGKLRAAAKGARKPKSRFAGRLELFTHLRVLLGVGKTLDVVSQVEVIDPFAPLRSDLERIGQAAFVAELTDRAVAEREPAPAVFSALRNALRMIATGDAEVAALWYAAQVMALTGYGPVTDRCVVCGKPLSGAATFSHALGGSLCPSHRDRDAQGTAASRVALAAIGFFRDVSPTALSRVTLDRRQRDEVGALLERYLEYRLETKLKSPLVIKRLRESTRSSQSSQSSRSP